MKTSLTRLSKIWHEKMSHLARKKKLKKATKMAAKEIRELEVRKVERKRIKNFLVNKITVITEIVRKNPEIIQSKLTNSIANKRKTEAWEEITTETLTQWVRRTA